MRLVQTPHVPHNWEAQMLFEEATSTLFCGDILTQIGNRGALVADEYDRRAIQVLEQGRSVRTGMGCSEIPPNR